MLCLIPIQKSKRKKIKYKFNPNKFLIYSFFWLPLPFYIRTLKCIILFLEFYHVSFFFFFLDKWIISPCFRWQPNSKSWCFFHIFFLPLISKIQTKPFPLPHDFQDPKGAKNKGNDHPRAMQEKSGKGSLTILSILSPTDIHATYSTKTLNESHILTFWSGWAYMIH